MATKKTVIAPARNEGGAKALEKVATAVEAKPDNGEKKKAQKSKGITCGLIMPISSIDGCPAEHWSEIKTIIVEAIESIREIDFTVKLVSDADDVGIIQKRIVQNVYNSDIVICDVSCKNPNVMFELGMRLAFDKPTVIVKDDKTDYSFDTSIIEHVTYPRDLRFTKIVEFKNILAEKTLRTFQTASLDPEHSTFLKSFGKFQIVNLNETEISPDKMVIELLSDLQSDVSLLRRRIDMGDRNRPFVDSGLSKIFAALRRLHEAKEIDDFKKVIGNEEFYRQIAKEIDAPSCYRSRREFNRAVDEAIQVFF